jgi:GT2 family glycosyltransferase
MTPPAPATPAISVVIVTFNGRDLVRACLSTVGAALAPRGGEVIVVDNGSADGTPEMIAAEFPDVRLLATGENLGFAAGNNRGLPFARGSTIVFLNPDTEPAPGSLSRLADALDADPTLGIVGPKLVNGDGSLQPSVRGFPNVAASLLVLLKLHRVTRWLPPVARYDAAGFDYDRAADVEQLMGACLALPRRVVEKLAGFDERFWMWFEEVDLCLRVRQAGLRVRYLPDAVVLHRLNQSAVLLHSVFTQRRYADSLVKFFAKHHPAWQAGLLRSVAWVGVAAAQALQAGRRLGDRSGTKYRIRST